MHVVGYPISQWSVEEIRANLSGFCNVAEIDPACLTNDNFAPLRLLLEIFDHRDIPRELWINEPRLGGHVGTVAQIIPICVWSRASQLRADGSLSSFFGLAPPPPAGPMLGPVGPFDRRQQLLPEPHRARDEYPPPANQPSPTFTPHGPGQQSLTAAQAIGSAALLSFALRSVRPDANPASPALHPVRSDSAPASPDSFNTVCSTFDGAVAATLANVVATDPMPVPPPPTLRAAKLTSTPLVVRRKSARLAAKDKGKFVDMTDRAIQQRALKDSLQTCSAGLQKHVQRHGLLSRTKLPIALNDIRKLARAADLGCSTSAAVDAVSPQPL